MLLQELSEARGVSGNEGPVRELIQTAIADHVDGIHVDALGNLICHKHAVGIKSGAPLRVMVAAHMDEIGLMITAINTDGTLSFGQVGGIDDRILLSKRVLVGDQAVPGVIGTRPIHLVPRTERNRVVDIRELAIDIGAKDKARAQDLVKEGDYVSFLTHFEVLTEDGLRTVKGKAFDDRAGCAILVELLKNPLPIDLYAAFTTQEEVGLRGARVAAYAIEPDVAFALEGTICDDLPKDRDESPVTEVGRGPAITLMDRSFIADRRLVKLLVDAAERLDIPYQFKKAAAGGTDAGAIHLVRQGVPSVAVAVPTRYIHAPVSLLSLRDLEQTIALMRATLQALPDKTGWQSLSPEE